MSEIHGEIMFDGMMDGAENDASVVPESVSKLYAEQSLTVADLRAKVAELEQENSRLRDWKQTILGFNGDPMPIAVERFRESEWCRVVVREWRAKVAEQAATIQRLEPNHDVNMNRVAQLVSALSENLVLKDHLATAREQVQRLTDALKDALEWMKRHDPYPPAGGVYCRGRAALNQPAAKEEKP